MIKWYNVDFYVFTSGKIEELSLKEINLLNAYNIYPMKLSLLLSATLLVATYQSKLNVLIQPDYDLIDGKCAFAPIINNAQGKVNYEIKGLPNGFTWKDNIIYNNGQFVQGDYELTVVAKDEGGNIGESKCKIHVQQRPLNSQNNEKKVEITQTVNKQSNSNQQRKIQAGSIQVLSKLKELINKLQKNTAQAGIDMQNVENQLRKAQVNEQQIINKINQNLDLKTKLATHYQSTQKQINSVCKPKISELQQTLSKSQTQIKGYEAQIQKRKQQLNQMLKEKQDLEKQVKQYSQNLGTHKTSCDDIKTKINEFATQKKGSSQKLVLVKLEKKKIQDIIVDEEGVIAYLRKQLVQAEQQQKLHQQQLQQISVIQIKGQAYLKEMQNAIDTQQVEFKNKSALQQQITIKMKQCDVKIVQEKNPKIQQAKKNHDTILAQAEKKKQIINQISAQIKKQTQYMNQGGQFCEHIVGTVDTININLQKLIGQRNNAQQIIDSLKKKFDLVQKQLKNIQQSLQKAKVDLASYNDKGSVIINNTSNLNKQNIPQQLKQVQKTSEQPKHLTTNQVTLKAQKGY